MSNSEEISEQLSAYLDGELSDEESRRVNEMLAGDSALSDELESLREVRKLLRNLPREQAPNGLIDAALAQAQRKHTGWWVGRLARAAVIVLAVGIGVIVMAKLDRPAQRNGAQSPLFVRGGLTGMGEAEPEEITNLFMNVDDLVRTQREVEGVFERNGIKLEVAAAEPERVVEKIKGRAEIENRANICNRSQVTPRQVCYDVVITDDQMRRVVSELNEISARQVVSQCPVRHRIRSGDEAIALARADAESHRYRSTTGARGPYEYGALAKRTVGKSDTKSVAAGGTAKADSGPARAEVAPGTVKDAASPTTIPAPSAVAMEKVAEARKTRTSGKTATMPAVNFRQLVVILNSAAEE